MWPYTRQGTKGICMAKNIHISVTLSLLVCFVACVSAVPGEDPMMVSGSSSEGYYHYSRGVLFMADGEMDKAIEAYERALRLDPESSYLMTELAELHIKREEIDRAVSLLEQAVALSPEQVDPHILLGSLYSNVKRYEDAVREYETVVGIDPGRREAYLFLNLLYREKREYEKAVSILDDLLVIDPSNLMGGYYLAKTYAVMEQYDKCELWLRKTLDIKPSFRPALVDLGMLYRSQAHSEKAVAIYEDFLRTNPADVQVRFELANTLMKSKIYDAASQEFETILRWESSLTEARFSLGLAYFFGGEKLDEAIAAFLEVLQTEPDNDKAIYFLASAYEKKGQYADALKELESISEGSGLYVASRVKMGFILQTDGRIQEAIALIGKEIKKTDTDPEFYRFLAVLYEEEEMFEDAEHILTEGLVFSPKNVDFYYRLGVVYGKQNKHEQSIAAMEALLEIDPDNADALNYIGYSYAERGVKLDEAESLIRKALLLKPNNGYIMDSLGWVFFQQNRLKEAIDYLKKAVKLLPQDPTIAGHLGDAYKKTGQVEEALDVYKEALHRNPGNSDLKEKIRRAIETSGE